MSHYFQEDHRKSVFVGVRFTPKEMKLIDNVMAAMGRTNKAQYLHNTMMSGVCRHADALDCYPTEEGGPCDA
ncbi:MAG: hypothetical protein IKN59_01405 [Paludibacteraceae bacterium]|nr:hypothetical protein [Paludibacteraceae bacterium]